MVLADSSIWIDFIRKPAKEFIQTLEAGELIMHPHVLGELSCGSFKNRSVFLGELARLPSLPVTSDHEVHQLIENHHLWGKGLGWVDCHLLTSCLLQSTPLYTRDKALRAAASKLKINWV